MPEYHLLHLDRNAYKASVAQIGDAKTRGFARLSMEWWDRHFSWRTHGCVVLADSDEHHLCYIFYKIDRYREYLTIHNIFTPLSQRRNGYAHTLLAMVFRRAIEVHVDRFRLASVPQSLDFYLALGFIYWGLNSAGDYYCDLPIPDGGLDELDAMIGRMDSSELLGNRRDAVYAKVHGNEGDLDKSQQQRYGSDKKKMGSHYRLGTLEGLQEEARRA